MKCSKCDYDYVNSEVVNPMYTSDGVIVGVCPICALRIRNIMHGLQDTEFQGMQANRLLKIARRERAKDER